MRCGGGWCRQTKSLHCMHQKNHVHCTCTCTTRMPAVGTGCICCCVLSVLPSTCARNTTRTPGCALLPCALRNSGANHHRTTHCDVWLCRHTLWVYCAVEYAISSTNLCTGGSKPITTNKTQCEAVAKILKTSDKTATLYTQTTFPPGGCFCSNSVPCSTLYFNTKGVNPNGYTYFWAVCGT